MRARMILSMTLLLLSGAVSEYTAAKRPERESAKPAFEKEVANNASDRSFPSSSSYVPLVVTQLDTFVLARFSFDAGFDPDPQGWHSVDMTVDADTFFHVAGANELNGGDFGGLVPLEGAQSMWCGVAPGTNPDLCYYATLPGYGSGWIQDFTSRPFARTGDVTISYVISWDTEPGYENVTVHYTDADGDWVDLYAGPGGMPYYDGDGRMFDSYTIPGSALSDSIQLSFFFWSDGAWDDEDGLWNTDGAVILDSLRLSDENGEMDFQDFESESPGAHVTADGDWRASRGEGFGDYAVLLRGGGLVQEDPCARDYSSMWAFIKGSTDYYECGGFPDQPAVPFYKMVSRWFYPTEVYMHNEIWSPFISWTHDLEGQPVPASASSALLEFDVYRDLPMDNLVFYFSNVRGVAEGCPVEWPTPVMLQYGEKKDWFRRRVEVAPLVPGQATHVQIALGVMDVCRWWCGYYGSGACHSHAPMFDNVRLVRVDQKGPAWIVEGQYLFQDNFATDGTTTGTVRADVARKKPGAMANGDSAVVVVTAPNVGIGYHDPGDPMSGPAVYCHVKNVSPSKSGPVMSGDLSRWPLASTGDEWSRFRCDHVRSGGGTVVADKFCFDLNDDLFTPGDTVYYYFSACDKNGHTNYYSVLAGVSPFEANARDHPMEFTCLPANALAGVTNILYVDDFDNRGAQPFFETAFEMLRIKPDRYDVLDPDRILGNGPGGRVVDVVEQIIAPYRVILWNSGDLESGLIGDGTGDPDAADDFALLYNFLDFGNENRGLYVSGDNVAEEWAGLTGASAVNLRSDYLNFNLVDGDHVNAGEPISPPVAGVAGGVFYHPDPGVDRLVAFGGECAFINNFDVLASYNSAAVEMVYSDNPGRCAVVSQVTTNAEGGTARVILSGFSYHSIRDDVSNDPIDRVEHLLDVLRWMQSDLPNPVGTLATPVCRYSLAQNYPNPFNPATVIEFTLGEKSRATLKIYNAAGQLVKTLVDEIRYPGVVYSAAWDGTNETGEAVASGVYFYKLVAGDFSRTRKMILLK